MRAAPLSRTIARTAVGAQPACGLLPLRSDLALVWLMEHGTFPMEVARAKYEDYLAAKQRLKEINARPTDSASGEPRSASRGGTPKVLVEPAADPGLSVGGDERMGQSSV